MTWNIVQADCVAHRTRLRRLPSLVSARDPAREKKRWGAEERHEYHGDGDAAHKAASFPSGLCRIVHLFSLVMTAMVLPASADLIFGAPDVARG